MELELKHVSLEGFRLTLDRFLAQEETQEGIVPDTLPDIMRIVEVTGQVLLGAKELHEGTLRITGTIQSTVLYVPEGEENTQHMELKIPFTCSMDDPMIDAACHLWAMPKLFGIDVQIINPRKVLVRAEIAVDLRVFSPENQKICTSAISSNECIQQHMELRQIYEFSWVGEKNFAFSDTLALPASKPRAVEMLQGRIQPGSCEGKVIGEKLILKGEAELLILYQSVNGPETAKFLLPYSQVMDIGRMPAESETFFETAITEFQCDLCQGEASGFSVKLGMLLSAAVIEKKPIELLDDIYSTEGLLGFEAKDCSLCVYLGEEKTRENVRHFCESAISAKSVIDVSVSVGKIMGTSKENKMAFSTNATAHILFLSEEDVLCSAEYMIPVLFESSRPFKKDPYCRCVPKGEIIALPVTGGMEVRFDVEFTLFSVLEETVSFVGAVKNLLLPTAAENRASVVLRKIGEGERLWDIAKYYQSTIEEIKIANEIETEGDMEGKMLLIPRRR